MEDNPEELYVARIPVNILGFYRIMQRWAPLNNRLPHHVGHGEEDPRNLAGGVSASLASASHQMNTKI